MNIPADKQKALESAMAQIERQFGKGSIMKLGSQTVRYQAHWRYQRRPGDSGKPHTGKSCQKQAGAAFQGGGI